MTVLYESNEADWKLLARGKVRDVYEFAPNEMLIVASDRISAFDVILPTPIPDKGVVLTQISNFWFAQDEPHRAEPRRSTRSRSRPTRRTRTSPGARSSCAGPRRCPSRRSCAATSPARGARTTSRPARCAASRCRAGLVEASRLPEPLFTPSTKAEIGDHDENISFAATADLIGAELAAKVRDAALELYAFGAA